MKKTFLEKEIERLDTMMTSYDGIDCDEIKRFKELLMKSKDSMKRKSPSGFNKMMLDRSAAKFRNWTVEKFKAHIEKLKKAFDRSREMTDEEFSKIDEVNKKAVKARESTLNVHRREMCQACEEVNNAVQNGDIDVEELLSEV